MRHGPAEDFAASGKDADRALTPSGRDRVRAVAKALRDHDEAPSVIVSSPLVRALQTAEIVAAEVGVERVETSRDLAPSGDAVALVRTLVQGGRKRAMVVGHEPDLSSLVASLCGAFSRDMLKAMVVGLQARAGEPTRIRFVLEPKDLRWEHADKSV
ncbi:MAG TPA: phosphohistidine phosphatase SixA [Polyangiaceae bacterium]